MNLLFFLLANTFSGTVSDTVSVTPQIVTQTVLKDSDDPAIWIHPNQKRKSLILGTDKDPDNGGIYAFDLKGKIVRKQIGMKRVNNVDVTYGFSTQSNLLDLAVATERDRQVFRILRLPSMEFVDGGGIPVFEGDQDRLPMGITTYKSPKTGKTYVIVGRKLGPSQGYLEQYELVSTQQDTLIQAKLVRKFGKYSGVKEIESLAVDEELGYVYYSDEQVGIRKYFAEPDAGDEELALFGQGDFSDDNEGISIYKTSQTTGYILVSNQGSNTFEVYPREGDPKSNHLHLRIATIRLKTEESDGSDVTSISLPGFRKGLFVAMSTDKTFQLYSWKKIAKAFRLKTR